MTKVILESLVKIGNHKKVIDECEPNVCFHFQLEPWMVKRTLKAQELLQNELYQTTGKSIPETSIPD